MFEILILMLDATIRTAPPLILAAMAGMFCERSGVVNIALEGKLLAAAFASGAAAAVSGSAWIGLGAGVGVSILFALMHGFATITHRGDQVVSGMAINILAAGLTVTLGRYWFDQGGQTPALSGDARFAPIDLPYAKELWDVPVIGQLYSELLSGHSLLEYVAFACVPLAWWVMFRTRFGLRLRAVGEAPAAVDTAGISYLGGADALHRAHHRRPAGRYRWHLSGGGPDGSVHPQHECGQGLYGTGGAGVRQVAPLECHGCLPAVRLPRCGRHSPARGQHRWLRHSGAGHRGTALHPDRVPVGRLYRPCSSTQGARYTLCEGAGVAPFIAIFPITQITAGPLRWACFFMD